MFFGIIAAKTAFMEMNKMRSKAISMALLALACGAQGALVSQEDAALAAGGWASDVPIHFAAPQSAGARSATEKVAGSDQSDPMPRSSQVRTLQRTRALGPSSPG